MLWIVARTSVITPFIPATCRSEEYGVAAPSLMVMLLGWTNVVGPSEDGGGEVAASAVPSAATRPTAAAAHRDRLRERFAATVTPREIGPAARQTRERNRFILPGRDARGE